MKYGPPAFTWKDVLELAVELALILYDYYKDRL